MEIIDGGLHPAVDGQSLGEGEGEKLMSKTYLHCAPPFLWFHFAPVPDGCGIVLQ